MMGIFIISMGVSSVMSWLGFGLVPPDGFGDDDDDALDVGAGVVVAPMTITLDLGLVAIDIDNRPKFSKSNKVHL